MQIVQQGRKVHINLDGSSLGYVVRGMADISHSPSVFQQHADCVLSTGEPVGFFGNAGAGSGGVSSLSWNSMSMNMIPKALGYDEMLSLIPHFVDSHKAKEMKCFSTVLIFHKIEVEKVSAFDNFWWEKKAARTGDLKPFHILGRNCSSFAYAGFKESNLLSDRPGLIDTPAKLFHHLVKIMKLNNYTLSCFSGLVSFNPHEKVRRNRIRDRNAKYDIIIEECKNYNL